LQRDFLRFGLDSFSFIVAITTSNEEQALKFEQILIDGFDWTYNILPKAGKACGRVHIQPTKDKMSISSIGKVISEEQRELLRKANLGKKASDETKRKMSDTHRKRIANGSANFYSKLKESDVLQILEMIDKKVSQKEIATNFNVSPSAVGHIAQGNTWKRVSEKYKAGRGEIA